MSIKPINNSSDSYETMDLPRSNQIRGLNFERRFYQVSLVLLLALLGFSFWYNQAIVEAKPRIDRYLILQNQFLFERVDRLPYEILRPMCWSPETGWCDTGMEQVGRRVVYLIDYQTDRYGVVMENDSGCWLWWFEESYGEDNNPHIAEHHWITCPAPLNQANK